MNGLDFDESIDIGERIKKIRAEKGLSQKELASRMGTTPQNLAQYENGIRKPKIETIKKIADALEVDFKILLPEFDKQRKEQELLAILARLYGTAEHGFQFVFFSDDLEKEIDKDAFAKYCTYYILGDSKNGQIILPDFMAEILIKSIDDHIRSIVDNLGFHGSVKEYFDFIIEEAKRISQNTNINLQAKSSERE